MEEEKLPNWILPPLTIPMRAILEMVLKLYSPKLAGLPRGFMENSGNSLKIRPGSNIFAIASNSHEPERILRIRTTLLERTRKIIDTYYK
jgi:hypothetical protein